MQWDVRYDEIAHITSFLAQISLRLEFSMLLLIPLLAYRCVSLVSKLTDDTKSINKAVVLQLAT